MLASELANEPVNESVELVVDRDAARAGAAVRARLDTGRRAAGFVGAPDEPAVAEFVADVLRSSAPVQDGRAAAESASE